MLETGTIIAIASCAVVLAIIISVQLAASNVKIKELVTEIRSWKTPDRAELGKRLAADQRPLPEIVEVPRLVETNRRVAPPAPIIWGGNLQQADQVRRLLGLPSTATISDGSLRSVEGRRVHVVFLVGTAGESPDGERMRQVLVRSGMKTSPEGAVFVDLRRLDA